jgi:metal-responsive CopG/Arc/MetJ family transcriptional regulator
MQDKKIRNIKSQNISPVRASISFPPDLYETLEEVARQKKVSLAWVVRDAAEKYVAEQRSATYREKRG